MKAANPYLNFKGNTEEAFNFYKSVFGGELLGVARFRDFADNSMGVAEADLDKIAHIALPLGPHNLLMATDYVDSMPFPFVAGNNFSITIDTDSAEEAERLFNALAAGGEPGMPLQKTEWAELYGHLTDKFGVQWMVNYTGSVEFASASSASGTSAA
ncbi:MAG: VOC family protein [Longimicrobiales bacterium]